MVAGLWAVAAGLLTVYATLRSIDIQQESAKRIVAAAARAQLKSAWSYIEYRKTSEILEKAVTDFGDYSLRSEKRGLPPEQEYSMPSYRGHLGPNWLSLLTTSPQSFGALPSQTAELSIGYFTELSNLIGRLNWLNDQSFTHPKDAWIIGVHQQTLMELESLKVRFPNVERKLVQCLG